jgi:hypothetical protein
MSGRYVGGAERRRSSRVGANALVHFRVSGSYGTGRLINLSLEGALVEASRRGDLLGAELALGFASSRDDDSCWLLASVTRRFDRMIGVRWCGQPPLDVMLRIQTLINRELDPLQPAEARLAALRARALSQHE